MLTALLVLRSSSRPAGRSVIIAGEEPVGAEDVRYKLCTNFTLIILQLFHVGVWTEMSFIVTELLHCLDSKDRKRMRVFKTWKTCQNKKRHLTFYPTAKRSVWLSGFFLSWCVKFEITVMIMFLSLFKLISSLIITKRQRRTQTTSSKTLTKIQPRLFV